MFLESRTWNLNILFYLIRNFSFKIDPKNPNSVSEAKPLVALPIAANASKYLCMFLVSVRISI